MTAQADITRHKRILRIRDIPGLTAHGLIETSTTTTPDLGRILHEAITPHLAARLGYSVILPSSMVLAAHLQQPVLDVLRVLQNLTRHGYQYEMSGLDSGVEVRLNPLSHYANQFSMLPNITPARQPCWRTASLQTVGGMAWEIRRTAPPLEPNPQSPLRRLTA